MSDEGGGACLLAPTLQSTRIYCLKFRVLELPARHSQLFVGVITNTGPLVSGCPQILAGCCTITLASTAIDWVAMGYLMQHLMAGSKGTGLSSRLIWLQMFSMYGETGFARVSGYLSKIPHLGQYSSVLPCIQAKALCRSNCSQKCLQIFFSGHGIMAASCAPCGAVHTRSCCLLH